MNDKCWDLACYFLGDEAPVKLITELANDFQGMAEDFLARTTETVE